MSSNSNKNSDRLALASALAVQITDDLQEHGYSELALEWLYDILSDALAGQSEEALYELTETVTDMVEQEREAEDDIESYLN